MYRFLPLLVVLAPHDSNEAVYAQGLLTVSRVVSAIVRLRSGKTMRRKTYEDKDVIPNKNLPTVFANSFNHSRARRHNIECKVSNMFTVNFMFGLLKSNSWRLESISCNSRE